VFREGIKLEVFGGSFAFLVQLLEIGSRGIGIICVVAGVV
jgi:hypothetical protein